VADAGNSLGAKALVIDDDVGVCQLICDLCDERGMEVWGASDGHLAMEIFRREWPRLVFVDLQLPDTDGLTLTRQVLALRPETAVVIITGHGTEEVAIGALHALWPATPRDVVELAVRAAIDHARGCGGEVRVEARPS